MNPLLVYRDPPLDGPTNMARDECLLYDGTVRPAALRIYAWEPPTISLGYFQRFDDVERQPPDVRDLPVVRRPTGGGAILHDREVTYCLVVGDKLPIARRAPVELYRLAHLCWRDALAAAGVCSALADESLPLPSPRSGPFFCFEQPGRTDLVVGPDKLLGSAQRRIPGRILQHGSLLLGRRFASHPGADLERVAALPRLQPQPPKTGATDAMLRSLSPPHGAIEHWISGFVQRMAAALSLQPLPADWTPQHLDDVARRRERFASDEWTRRF
jgi:lipoate-protein ligase A